MNSNTIRRLHDNDTLRLLPGRGGLVLTSRAGTFLVTQERDPKDHVLQPGSAVRTAGRGVVVVWALSDGTIGVEPARAA
jgi:Protein of unknown function (DUF2917)